MWVYILNIVTIPIYYKLIKNKKVFFAVVALQLFLILALRSVNLGVDLDNYSGGYKYIKSLNFEDLSSRLNFFGLADLVYPFSYESGYTVFNWLASHIGLNFHGFLVVCAAIDIISVSWFIYRYSKKPWLSFIIFATFGFFVYDFGIIRQSLALSLVLLSYIFFDKNKKIAGVLSFIIAFSFHRVSIIALPLLFIPHIKTITQKRFLVLMLLSVPILLLSSIFYNTTVVNIMLSMGKGYLGHDLIINNMLIFLFGMMFLVLMFCNFSKIKDKIDSVACYALVFALYFSIFGLYNDVLSRALQFYSIFLIVLIPNLLEQYSAKRNILIVETVIYLFFVGFMVYSVSGSVLDPYVVNTGGFLW